MLLTGIVSAIEKIINRLTSEALKRDQDVHPSLCLKEPQCLIKGVPSCAHVHWGIFTPGNKNSWLLQLHVNISFKVAFGLKWENNIFRTRNLKY